MNKNYKKVTEEILLKNKKNKIFYQLFPCFGKEEYSILCNNKETQFILHRYNHYTLYLNKNGWHNEDGPAFFVHSNDYSFYLNDYLETKYLFAIKTNHQICLICEDFCNQECFI